MSDMTWTMLPEVDPDSPDDSSTPGTPPMTNRPAPHPPRREAGVRRRNVAEVVVEFGEDGVPGEEEKPV